MNKALFIILITSSIIACKKENRPAEPKPEPPNEFTACNCQPAPGKDAEAEYIKADINGVSVCFDQKPAIGDSFSNLYSHGFILRDTGNQYYDNLAMIRNAYNSEWQVALFFENTYALTKTYPYNLPRPNSEVCEIGELQLNNQSHYTSCTFCATNNYNFYAPFFGNAMKFTATGFTNNVFEGTFSGTAQTGSGRTVSVTNGKFRVKLLVRQVDIKVH